jgi:hypothetical protein
MNHLSHGTGMEARLFGAGPTVGVGFAFLRMKDVSGKIGKRPAGTPSRAAIAT